MRTIVVGASIASLVVPGAPAGTIIPTPIGVGPRFHPTASNPRVADARPVGSLACSRTEAVRYGVHLELFARGRVVIVPAGIGVAPPLARRGGNVLSGRCSYPLRTREPTGVIEVARSARLRLGDFFAVWGRPLGRHRLIDFRGGRANPVRAYVGGRRFRGSPLTIPLHRHAQIVLELGGYIPPHRTFRFRSGL